MLIRCLAPWPERRRERPSLLQAEIRVEGDGGQLLHLVILAALGVLDKDRSAVAVAALRGRVGAEIDLARNDTLEVADLGERVADRGAVFGERSVGQLQVRL